MDPAGRFLVHLLLIMWSRFGTDRFGGTRENASGTLSGGGPLSLSWEKRGQVGRRYVIRRLKTLGKGRATSGARHVERPNQEREGGRGERYT